MTTLKSFQMQREKDAPNRYKIRVVAGNGFDENPDEVIFWLPATTVEDWDLFTVVVKKRIAQEFKCKPEEVHWSYTTAPITKKENV